MSADSTTVFIGAWSYTQVRALMVVDAQRIGWHQHGTRWVWGIAPDDGCWLCDTAEAHWAPRLQAAARADRSTGDVDVARRARLAAARRAGILVGVAPTPAASASVVHVAMLVNKPTSNQVELPNPSAAPMVLDDELADAPTPSMESAPPPPPPTFALSHPTAESIRRNRKKRP